MSWAGSHRLDEGVEMRGPAERVARDVPNKGFEVPRDCVRDNDAGNGNDENRRFILRIHLMESNCLVAR